MADDLEMIDLDYELLIDAPAEGAKVGLTPLGMTVKHLRKQEKYQGLTSEQIASRLRTLKFHGFVIDVTVLPVGLGRGWQRTAKGDEILAARV